MFFLILKLLREIQRCINGNNLTDTLQCTFVTLFNLGGGTKLNLRMHLNVQGFMRKQTCMYYSIVDTLKLKFWVLMST